MTSEQESTVHIFEGLLESILFCIKGWRVRPKRRLWDDLNLFLSDWSEAALDREELKAWSEAYAQQWDIYPGK